MKKLSWKKVGCLLLALLMAATMLATGVVATYDNVYNSDSLPETASLRRAPSRSPNWIAMKTAAIPIPH